MPQQQSGVRAEAEALRQQLIEQGALDAGTSPQQEGTARAPEIGAKFLEGFLPNQPIQNPLEAFRALKEAGVGGVLSGIGQGMAGAVSSGVEAVTNPPETRGTVGRFVPPPFNNPRALNLFTGGIPVLGQVLNQAILEPAAQALEAPGVVAAAEPAAQAAGGAAGLGLSFAADKGLGAVASRARQSISNTRAAARAGELLTAGQRQGAMGITTFAESMVSRFPGGRRIIEGARNASQVNLVQNGINRVLGMTGNFRGTRLQLLDRVGKSVNEIIENLRKENRALYAQFDEALEASNQRLGVRGPPTRGQAARGLGGDEVTALVPQSQAGASVGGVRAAGVKVTGFLGDTISEVATRVLARVGSETMLVGDPALRALVTRVQGLTQLSGRTIPVTVATDARSTILQLARRIDNPLGSKEGRVLGEIFDPIDSAIERTLREVGGDDLVSQWRTANGQVRKLHELVDDTLFEQVVKSGSPEQISAAFNKASAVDLARIKGRLPKQDWDNVRTLMLRDRMARRAVSGELPTVSRGGASPAGAGRPLRIDVDAASTPRVARNAINDTLNDMDESIRGILFSDEELRAWSSLNEAANRVSSVGDEIGKLIGSGIAAGTMVGAAGAIGGTLLGVGPGFGAAASAIGAVGALTLGSKGTAWILTRPDLMDIARASIATGGRDAVRLGIVGRQILNAMPQDVLQEFIGENGVPPNSLPADIRGRAFGGSNPLTNAFRLPTRQVGQGQ